MTEFWGVSFVGTICRLRTQSIDFSLERHGFIGVSQQSRPKRVAFVQIPWIFHRQRHGESIWKDMTRRKISAHKSSKMLRSENGNNHGTNALFFAGFSALKLAFGCFRGFGQATLSQIQDLSTARTCSSISVSSTHDYTWFISSQQLVEISWHLSFFHLEISRVSPWKQSPSLHRKFSKKSRRHRKNLAIRLWWVPWCRFQDVEGPRNPGHVPRQKKTVMQIPRGKKKARSTVLDVVKLLLLTWLCDTW